MSSLTTELTRNLPGELSCPSCGSNNIQVLLFDDICKSNPMGETMASIQCKATGCQLAKDVYVDELKEEIKKWIIDEVLTYWCSYRLDGDDWYLDVPSVVDVKDGFWITGQRKFTQGSDGTKWIPPAQIQYIDKKIEERRLG